eukprot:1486980-Amphidinium_carterae.1
MKLSPLAAIWYSAGLFYMSREAGKKGLVLSSKLRIPAEDAAPFSDHLPSLLWCRLYHTDTGETVGWPFSLTGSWSIALAVVFSLEKRAH